MSAYLVPEKQIAAITKWYFMNTKPTDRRIYNMITDRPITTQTSNQLATILAQANVDSLTARYGDGLFDAEGNDKLFIEQCADLATIEKIGGVMTVHDPDCEIDPASMWNLCCNLDYQNCEVEDWEHTDAYWIIRKIMDRAAEKGLRTSQARMTWGWDETA